MKAFNKKHSTLIMQRLSICFFLWLTVFSFFASISFFEEKEPSQYAFEEGYRASDKKEAVLAVESLQLKTSAILSANLSKISLLINSKMVFLKIKHSLFFSDLKLFVYKPTAEKQKASFNDFIKLVYLSSQHYPPPY